MSQPTRPERMVRGNPLPVLETSLYVDDLAGAERFYAGVLGLQAFARSEGRHLFFRVARGVLLLFNPEETADAQGDVPAHGARGPGHVAFGVGADEMGSWQAWLEHNGVRIEARMEWPGGGRSIYFRDPAGNSLELTTPETWGLGPSSKAGGSG